MRSRSFQWLSDTQASTKRNPAAVAGVVAAPATYLTGLELLPIMPVSDDIRLRYTIESPREAYVTYIQGVVDIVEGDILVVDSVSYPVRAASPWPAHNYTEVIVDKVVGT